VEKYKGGIPHMKKLLITILVLALCCPAALATENNLKMSEEKVTFTVLQAINDSLNLDADTNYAIQWLEEQTNVKLDYEFVKVSDWDTKFNLAMVSGELPDIIWSFDRLDDEEYGVIQQLFIPVDGLIDEFMPNLKAMIEEDPESMRNSYASDGHIYGLPAFYDNLGIDAMGFQFINTAWLEKVNLEVPTTVEELTEVLRAFKTQDPNGNGLADEVPYSCSFNDHVNAGIWSLFFYFGVPTDGITYFSLDEEGVVTFDPYRPGFRAAVEWMHTLYAEGLMDMEALTQDVPTFISKVNDGVVGCMPFVATIWYGY
jgi:putative aldouronate transport system substrate-binding protein